MLELMFYSSLASGEEMKAFATSSFTSKNGKIVCTEKLAGMLEGGERTPMLNPVELEEIGSMVVSYPLYLIGISISTLEVGVEQVIPYQ
ncbi:unnamed protein product [Musa banksii]